MAKRSLMIVYDATEDHEILFCERFLSLLRGELRVSSRNLIGLNLIMTFILMDMAEECNKRTCLGEKTGIGRLRIGIFVGFLMVFIGL